MRAGVLVIVLAALPGVGGPQAPMPEMVRIDGGTFRMGSAEQYREERPVRTVILGPFLISRTEVTNDQFAAFVAAMGYVTTSERGLDPATHPGWPPELLAPGSMVFAQPDDPVSLADPMAWWRYVPGADWRHPEGPGSSIEGLGHHLVVQVSPEDAEAYAAWAGGRLPTEAEWEFAALGGIEGGSWGKPYDPAEDWKANAWQGAFPGTDLADNGHHGTAPAASYPASAYGLHDMLRNVWEHVADWWVPGHPEVEQTDPAGPPEALAARFSRPEIGPMRVVKGGSWLCAPAYCRRYRPVARQPQDTGLGSNHIGVRIAKDAE